MERSQAHGKYIAESSVCLWHHCDLVTWFESLLSARVENSTSDYTQLWCSYGAARHRSCTVCGKCCYHWRQAGFNSARLIFWLCPHLRQNGQRRKLKVNLRQIHSQSAWSLDSASKRLCHTDIRVDALHCMHSSNEVAGPHFDKCGKRGSGWAVCYLICVLSKPLTVPCPRSDKHSCVCGSWQPPRACLSIQQRESGRRCRGFSSFSPRCSTALWVDMYKTVQREEKCCEGK